ncbi:hypothetical protein GM418_11005 [Maribellus comscasis]|uniref:Uncharacterized protein n=1 Tax=Maribellus comscasis TaxID=2681766 RepID=A0A6I6JSV9_9BACT|nr:hypothetical protein [Maribellus comscasis]QGY44168.1 hypothetical protein GM418_11005 [Maribellus comscasis]
MKVEFNYVTFNEMQETIEKFKEFRERYINVAAGRWKINDDNLELERINLVLEVEDVLEELLDGLREYEIENPLHQD